MINHGLSTGALFLIVGMIYERRHTRDMDAFGGLVEDYAGLWRADADRDPVFDGPAGLNGFVGEFTILLGAFGSQAMPLGSPGLPGWRPWV